MPQKGFAHILLILILLAGIIVGVYLIKHPQIFRPKAGGGPIWFTDLSDNALPVNSSNIPQTTSASIKIQLISTLGDPAVIPTPSPSVSPTPNPTTDPIVRRVFITSATYNGNLGGVSGADAKCQASADSAGLGGVWKAWISDASNYAGARLDHSTVPYQLLNGSILADNYNSFNTGQIKVPLNIDERIAAHGFGYVWTATSPTGSGLTSESSNCQSWTSFAGTDLGGTGGTVYTNSNWTDQGEQSCNSNLRLYCFEQSSAPVPTSGSVYTSSFRYAEDPSSLDLAAYIPYTEEPTIIPYALTDVTPGVKFIWVDFKDSNGNTDRRSAQIEIVGPASPIPSLTPSPTPTPTPTSVPQPPSGGPADIPIIGPILAPFFPEPTPIPVTTPAPTSSSTPVSTPKPVITTCPSGTVREECLDYASNSINDYCWGANNNYLGGKCSINCGEPSKCGLAVPKNEVCDFGQTKECLDSYSANGANAYCWQGSTYVKSICNKDCSNWDSCK